MNRLPGSPRLRASAAIFHFLIVFMITDGDRLERNRRSDASPNGQDSGLRSRGLVHPEHALCLAELFPDVKWLIDGVYLGDQRESNPHPRHHKAVS